ncbi:zinc knuckle CX2CX4HX4C containing protein [Tanacetum coccineum]
MVPLSKSFKEELSRVPVWVKFYDVLLGAYTSDGLSLITSKIGTPMMLDSFANSMYLESWETIRVEYEWETPRCSTCLVFGHSVDECLKAPKRVVDRVDKGKGGSSGADDDGFIKVKRKKSGDNNESTKIFRPVSVKQKPIYRPNSTREASLKMAPPANMKKVSIPGNSSKKTVQTNASTSGNGTFFLSNSFEVLNADNSVAEDVVLGDRIVISSVQEEGQSSTSLVEKINLVEQRLSDGEPYGTTSLLEQWRNTYGDIDHEYDPYDDDLYEGHEISDKNQSICDNLDIKVRGRKKK